MNSGAEGRIHFQTRGPSVRSEWEVALRLGRKRFTRSVLSSLYMETARAGKTNISVIVTFIHVLPIRIF